MTNRIRVLILEDNPSDADLMVDVLKQAGFDPEWERVELEVDFASRLAPELDLILSDNSLPQFTGIRALQLVRARGLDVPFILVSGSIGEDIAVEAMRGGADDYLLKDRMARLGPAVLQALEKRRLRLEKDQAESAQRESEAKFRQLIEQASDGIFVTDTHGKILIANSRFCEMLGYREDELLERNITDTHPEADRSGMPGRLARLAGIKSRIFERMMLRKDDTCFPVEISIRYLANGTHQGIVRDITERKLHEQKIEKLSRVRAVSSGINSILIRVRNRQELFQQSCQVAVDEGQFPFAWIGTLDPTTQDVTPVAWSGERADELTRAKSSARDDNPRGKGAVGQAIRNRRAVINNDIAALQFGGPRVEEILRLGFRSQLTLPLFEDKTVIGTLTMYAREPNFFDEEELKLLTELAGDISFALENIARQEKLDKLSRIRAVSSEINAAIVRIRERETLLQETCRIASEHGKFELVWVGEIDHEAQKVRPVASAGFSRETAHGVTWAGIAAARGTLGEAILTRKPAVRNDMGTEMAAGKLREEALARGCGSTICLPIVVDEKVAAAVILFASGSNFFDDEELALLEELAADVSFASQNIVRQEKLDYLSYYDTLTGLPNRTLFLDRAGQQLHARGGEHPLVAMALFDIERFQYINETLGRHGGDELLKLVARRLAEAFHGNEHLARVGANTFGVVMRGIRDTAGLAHAVEDQALGSFREPYQVNSSELRVTAKAGIAIFPADGDDADALYRSAEAALKRAKESGERYLFYAADMHARAVQTLSMENRLRTAVEAQQFVLHYQPKINLATGTICGLEALIRWQDPESGLVPPGAFIPMLEQTGLIREAGRWALAQALADYCDWAARGLSPPRIAVNVSAIQLQQPDFVDVVVGVVQGAGNVPEALELEVTESLTMKDLQASTRKLSILRGLGITIAMDDFGTGYSSLSYIARLPINSLKIDRSFVNGMAGGEQDMAIVTTIIALAHSLNLKVVAEGVETEEQAQMLAVLKCDEVQGFLYSKPLPAEEIEPRLRARVAEMRPGGKGKSAGHKAAPVPKARQKPRRRGRARR